MSGPIENKRGRLPDAGPADGADIAGATAVGVELQQEEVVRARPVVGTQAQEALGGIRKRAVLGIIDEHDGDANRNRLSRLPTMLRAASSI
jgi:hypothetical protein